MASAHELRAVSPSFRSACGEKKKRQRVGVFKKNTVDKVDQMSTDRDVGEDEGEDSGGRPAAGGMLTAPAGSLAGSIDTGDSRILINYLWLMYVWMMV